jgi:hypothetical protein
VMPMKYTYDCDYTKRDSVIPRYSDKFILMLRMVEEWKKLYMLYLIIQNLQLLPELRSIVFKLLFMVNSKQYFNNFEPYEEIKHYYCGGN